MPPSVSTIAATLRRPAMQPNVVTDKILGGHDARPGGRRRHQRLPRTPLAFAGGAVDGGVEAADRDHDDEEERQHHAEDELAHLGAAGDVTVVEREARPLPRL